VPRRLEGQSGAFCYTSAALSALILLSTLPGWKTKDVGSGAHAPTPHHLFRHENCLLQNTTAYTIQAGARVVDSEGPQVKRNICFDYSVQRSHAVPGAEVTSRRWETVQVVGSESSKTRVVREVVRVAGEPSLLSRG
jgi:hypothetical protein